MTRISEQVLSTFLERVSSTRPAPGSGASGAVSLALGVACARKAVGMSLKHHPDDERLAKADVRLAAITKAALDNADEDARYFARLITALRLPHDEESDAAARAAAIGRNAGMLVAIAERLLLLCEEVQSLIRSLAETFDPLMANDVKAALALIESAAVIQRANAAENRRHMV